MIHPAQRHTHSTRRAALLLLAVIVVLAGTAVMPATATHQHSAAAEKITSYVRAATRNGSEAEFLVVLAEQANLQRPARLSDRMARRRAVRAALWDTARTSQRPLRELLRARSIEHRSFYSVNALWVRGNADLAAELAARPDVARIEGNPRVRQALPAPLPVLAMPQAGQVEPNIVYTGAPDVWALGYTGQGIVIGGQDTGYNWDHPALKPHYRGWNGSEASHDYNWHDSIHTDQSACGADSVVPCDDNSHGTHTMGIVVGDDGGDNRTGMAPGATWIGCRNMENGFGTPASYLECFDFFLAPYPVGGTPAEGDPAMAPDIITNSWTCPTYEGCEPDTLRTAVEAQQAAGILVVASAGNDGPACSSVAEPPAIYEAAYVVGALQTGTDTIAAFSGRGPVDVDGSNRSKPDMSAPGTAVRSAVNGGGYSSFSGTSMAAPHVAGAAALLWSAAPDLRGDISATRQALNAAAVPIASSACGSDGVPNNTYGHGRLDIYAAVRQAVDIQPPAYTYLPVVQAAP